MRRVNKLTPTVLVTLGVLAFGVAPAFAGHGSTGSFVSEQGAGNGEFSLVTHELGVAGSGVAVNDSKNSLANPQGEDVYVTDTRNNRVEYFSSTGTYIGQFNGSATPAKSFSSPEGIAVDSDSASPSFGDVYVIDTGHDVIDKFEADGTYLNQIKTGSGGVAFDGLLGVAVDSGGAVWVYEGIPGEEDGEVDTYSNALVNGLTSTRKTTVEGGAEGQVQPGFAVDAEGNLYVVHRGRQIVAKLSGAGFLLNPPGEELGEEGPKTAIAVDLSDNDVFIGSPRSVSEFTSGGSLIQEFGSGAKALSDGGGAGIAVNSANGTVYVADSVSNRVIIFGEGPSPEAPLTEPAGEIKATTAVLHGQLNPKVKAEAGWYFAYNLGASCTGAGSQTTSEEAEADVKEQAEEKEITGLEPNAQYTFCFVAQTEFGHTLGLPETLTTAPAPPEIGSESISGATTTAATLEAQINPNNEATSYTFEYSTTENGAGVLTGTIGEVKDTSPVNGYPAQPASVPTGAVLKAGTTYFYRVIAQNKKSEEEHKPVEYPAAGVQSQSFATVPAPVTDLPNPLGTTTATLHGTLTLNPDFATKYSFDYNLGPVCTVPTLTPAEEDYDRGHHIPIPVQLSTQTEEALTGTPSAKVEGLQPNTEYAVCFFTSNQFSSVAQQGSSVPFKTHPAPPKFIASSESAAAIASATGPAEGVGAFLNPNNEATSYTFEYSTSEAEVLAHKGAKVNSAVPLEGFNETGDNATAHIENLTAGATYYYRVIAENKKSEEEHQPVEGEVEQFTASVAPTVTTGAAQDPARTSIVLSGTVDPNGVATTYHFAYIDEAGYQAALAGDAEEKANPYINGATTASQKACTEAELLANPATCNDEGTATLAVEVPAKGLLPGVTYDYALVADTATSTISGVDETFATAPTTAPLVTTGAASEVTMSTATIAGSVNTEGLDVSYAFEVSTEAANPTEPCKLSTPSGGGSIGAGPTEADVSVALQGLQPGTTYYYCVLGTSTDGTSYGEVRSFTTPGFPAQLVQPGTALLIPYTSPGFPAGSQGNTQSPGIEVISHKIKGNTATLEVELPSAGKLVATGKGVSKGTAKSTKPGDVTVEVTLTKTEQARLAKHKGRKLLVKVNLTFTPTKGSVLSTSVTVLVG